MGIKDDILAKTISWYEFENGSGSVVTDVHGGKDATLSTIGTGTSEFNTTSKLGDYSLRLAGSDGSNKGEFKVTDAALTPSFPFSTGFWVRGDVINDGDKNMGVYFGARGCTSTSYAGVAVSVSFSSGVAVQYGDNVGSNCSSGSRTSFAASKSFNANQWYFVVVNFINGSSLDVFVDDVDLGAAYTNGDGSGVGYANNDFVMGYFPGTTTGSGVDRHNQGWADNVMVFNDVLTSAEISYLYNSGSGVNYESIVSFFDDFSGDLSNWDISTLDSASIVNGKLVTEAPANTWNDNSIGAYHVLSTPLSGDFVASANLEWVGRSSDLTVIRLLLKSSNGGFIEIGIGDAQAADDTKDKVAMVDYGDGTNDEFRVDGGLPDSGVIDLKLTRESGVVKAFFNGVLDKTFSPVFNGDITEVWLINNRFETYNGVTAKWNFVNIGNDLVTLLNNAVVSYYNLDENTGSVAGDSKGGNDGTINGATWTSGKIGSALSFDGTNDVVELSNDGSFAFSKTDSFTIMIWLKTVDDSTSGTQRMIGMERLNTSGVLSYSLNMANNKVVANIAEAGVGNSVSVTTSSNFNDGNWYLVELSYDNAVFELYVDNVYIGQNTFTGNGSGSSQVLSVGARRYENVTDAYYTGDLDEPVIFNRTLTSDERTFLYNNGNPGSEQQYSFTAENVTSSNINSFYVDNVTKNTARLNTSISTDQNVNVVFEYKKVGDANWITVDKGNVNTNTLVQHDLTGLEELKNYEFRVKLLEVV